MKVLTLNTHSLIESNYNAKLAACIEGIGEVAPDVFAMQEVNQSIRESLVQGDDHYCFPAALKVDNHGLAIQKGLKLQGLDYYWAYCPCHVGYGIYDEGIALFSRYPFEELKEVCFSEADDYKNYQTRKAILAKIKIENQSYLFVSVHMGWWQKEGESFAKQWDKLKKAMEEMASEDDVIVVMGDFNSPSHIRHEGYDYLLASGYYDTYELATVKDNGATASSAIDGWKSKEQQALRIDYVIVNQEMIVDKHKVIFNGRNKAVVSDHYGIIVEMRRSK